MNNTKITLKILCSFIALSILITIILSLSLTFCINNRATDYGSTGANLLSFSPDFFQDDFQNIGLIASLIYLFFIIINALAIIPAIIGIILKKIGHTKILIAISSFIAIAFGITMVTLAFVCVTVSTITMNYKYTYSTNFYFLIIPIIISLISTIAFLIVKEKN